MDIKVNGTSLAQAPTEFTVTPLDIDDSEATGRTADGTLHRARIAVKRQIDMSWGLLNWADTASILQAMEGPFFELTYPDPMDGKYMTRTFYAGNRPTPAALSKGGTVYWSKLKMTLTER
ncbi:DUF6711 family protein [Cohnella sp. GbtcB17]|uniref:DUF6711 family protein n=1 Tax=Cohnella sp. GbtcB17 TaxID=2824762 RepID=UPI001C2F4256|nr:DUF6711 family protein [Cohnella sp. GbtcB17]